MSFFKGKTNFIISTIIIGNSTLKTLALQGIEIKIEFDLGYLQILCVLINNV